MSCSCFVLLRAGDFSLNVFDPVAYRVDAASMRAYVCVVPSRDNAAGCQYRVGSYFSTTLILQAAQQYSSHTLNNDLAHVQSQCQRVVTMATTNTNKKSQQVVSTRA